MNCVFNIKNLKKDAVLCTTQENEKIIECVDKTELHESLIKRINNQEKEIVFLENKINILDENMKNYAKALKEFIEMMKGVNSNEETK